MAEGGLRAAPVRDLAEVVVRQSLAARGSVPGAGAERDRDGASAGRAAVSVPAPDLHRGAERGGRDDTLAARHRAPAGLIACIGAVNAYGSSG